MKTRTVAPLALLIAAAAAVLLWRCHGSGSPKSATKATNGSNLGHGGATAPRDLRPDPRKQPRASIEGAITADDTHAPIAKAKVCAQLYSNEISSQLVRDPICTVADDAGHYVLKDLFAAEYEVAASAKPYRPAIFHPGGEREQRTFPLAAGEKKTGVDIALRAGGVEVTGVVQDISGGPIAHALVSASTSYGNSELVPPVETDDSGAFSMYVAPGRVVLAATADGYASASDDGQAPGNFQLLLTPESSLAGVVVDAKTGEPMPGVMVEASSDEWGFGFFGAGDTDNDITDEHGAFRISRLEPDRYRVAAHSAHGYGVSAGSTLVGLGQHVEGVVVKLHPGYRIAGTVVLPDKTLCKTASLSLNDQKRGKYYSAVREPDNTLHADGVLPGTYSVDVGCDGYLAKDHYDKLVVDKDVDKLVWEVEGGAVIRGRVLTKSGAPVEDAQVWARSVGGAARAKTGWGGDTSRRDGTYEMKGLKPGSFKLEASSELGNAPLDGWKVDVAANATVEKDLVLDDGGKITGTVVDDKGKPVTGVQVHAWPLSGGFRWGFDSVRTKPDGSFTIENVRPGQYRVVAQRGMWSDDLRKPGSTDDDKQGEKVTVTLAKPATVKLVVESLAGAIKGTISDATGAPVSDAFLSAARESDAAGAQSSNISATRWSWDDKPVLSNPDGTFAITGLTPGTYTVRAYRKGGGEAVAEHIAVGSTAKLVIKPTGSISGTVRQPSGTPIEEIKVELSDSKTGFERTETFFRTDGAFALHDLPAGHFTLTASADTGKKQMTIDLAEGQQQDGIAITLDELVTLTGRVVDMQTKAPVSGMRMMAGLAKGNTDVSFGGDDESYISDAEGRFTLEDAPRGKLMIRGFPKDWNDGEYGFLTIARDVSGSGTIDLGDIPVLKKRLKPHETAGELGLHFVQQPPDAEPEQQQYKVSYIDPAGPCAKLDIKIGDVIATVDGIDIQGVNFSRGWTLMSAPVGTALKLGLARGATVTAVLAAP